MGKQKCFVLKKCKRIIDKNTGAHKIHTFDDQLTQLYFSGGQRVSMLLGMRTTLNTTAAYDLPPGEHEVLQYHPWKHYRKIGEEKKKGQDLYARTRLM